MWANDWLLPTGNPFTPHCCYEPCYNTTATTLLLLLLLILSLPPLPSRPTFGSRFLLFSCGGVEHEAHHLQLLTHDAPGQ